MDEGWARLGLPANWARYDNSGGAKEGEDVNAPPPPPQQQQQQQTGKREPMERPAAAVGPSDSPLFPPTLVLPLPLLPPQQWAVGKPPRTPRTLREPREPREPSPLGLGTRPIDDGNRNTDATFGGGLGFDLGFSGPGTGMGVAVATAVLPHAGGWDGNSDAATE
jgi:hypothetical protein